MAATSPAESHSQSSATPLKSSWAKSVLPILPVLLPMAVSLITGLIGLDFGRHWDEPYNMGFIATAIRSHVLLPRYYNYPSVMFWLIFASLLPVLPGAIRSENFHLIDYVQSNAALLNTRIVFLVISTLAIVWVYLLVLVWRKNWKEALLSASVLGLSWEVNYHIRWVTPDGIMMQFAALTLLFLVLAIYRPGSKFFWLKAAAIAAGLTTGSKYTAALLIVPLLLTLYLTWDHKALFRTLILPAAQLCFIMGLTYLITTPGTVLDPVNFLEGLKLQLRIYSHGHEVHTINGGSEHFLRMMQFFSLVLFSPFAPIALIFFLFVLVGAYATWKENWNLALVILAFPVLYILYFSTQRAMILRNQLIVIPFLAVLVGRGVAYVVEQLRNPMARRVVASVVAALLIVNGVWLFYAAQTIVDRSTDRFTREFAAYISAHPNEHVYVTPAVMTDLALVGMKASSNLNSSLDDADLAAFYGLKDALECIPANRPDTILRWFGPLEVDYSYYTTWPGNDRIVLMRGDQARQLPCFKDK